MKACYVYTHLMRLCDPEDEEYAEMIAEMMAQYLQSQVGIGVSGAWF